MTDYPHVQAAFINAIREEGTKGEACDYLQKSWNEMCALRAEVSRLALEAREWQPIETAPKDGTEFLACDASDAFDGNFQQVVYWDDAYKHAGRTLTGWHIVDGALRPPVCFTHWQPLPTPPAAAIRKLQEQS